MSEQQYTDEQAIHKIEELKKKSDHLNNRKIRIDALLERLSDELGAAKIQAKESFGTDDVLSLKKKLEERRDENSTAINTFEKELHEAETAMNDVETLLAAG